MRRLLLAVVIAAAVLVPAASASATTYATGTTYLHFTAPSGGDFNCTGAGLDVTGSAATMTFSGCRWYVGVAASITCATATYSARLLSAINCQLIMPASASCRPIFSMTGSVPLTGLITVLNSGQALTATVLDNAACNGLFRLTAGGPHAFPLTWGSASGGTGNIVFV